MIFIMNKIVVFIAVLTSSFCLIFAYRVSPCDANGKVYIPEASPAVFTCEGITDDSVMWFLKRDDGFGKLLLGYCFWRPNLCSVSSTVRYAVSRPEFNSSTLTVKEGFKATIAGAVLQCGKGEDLVSCTVIVETQMDTTTQGPTSTKTADAETPTTQLARTTDTTTSRKKAFLGSRFRFLPMITTRTTATTTTTTATPAKFTDVANAAKFAPIITATNAYAAATTATTTTTSTVTASRDSNNDVGTAEGVRENKKKKKAVVVGGAVGGGVLTLIVVAVVAIVVWRKKCVPIYAEPLPRSQVIDNNVYTGLLPQQQPCNYQAYDTRQYENVAAEGEHVQEMAEYENVAKKQRPASPEDYEPMADAEKSTETLDYMNVA